MIYKFIGISYVIWAYLNQPVTTSKKRDSVWKFKRFLYLYQIRLLENCWRQDTLKVSKYRNLGQDEYTAEN